MKAESSLRREYLWLLLVVVGALILRTGLASVDRVIRWDEPDYLSLGRNLLTGRGYTVSGVSELHYTPLFPILAGAIYVLTGNPELGSAFWYVLLGALVLVPIYFLVRRLYGSRIALLAIVLLAIFPGLSSAVLYWGTMTEPVFIFWLFCALWALSVALDDGKIWAFALGGACLGLAYLSRPEGLVWLAGFLVLFLLIWIWRRQLWRWRSLASLVAYLAAFVIVAAPYVLFVHSETGKWMATGKLSITYDIGEAVLEDDPVLYDKVTASLDSETGEVLWWSSSRFERSILDVLLEDPRAFLVRMWRNLKWMKSVIFSSRIFPLFLLAPVVLGWFREPWNRRRLEHEALLWFGALPVLSFLPFHVEVRFFSPAFPVLVIWAAVGVWGLASWLAETLGHWRLGAEPDLDEKRWPLARWHGIALLLLVVGLSGYWGVVHARTVQQGVADMTFSHEAAGRWLREHAPADAKVMTRDLAVALYAERGFVPSPRAEYDAYLDYARRKGATYLVVDEHELRVLRPHLAFLLNDANPPPELLPLFAAVDGRGRTIVYQIKD